jgi:hypothetical protein
MPVWYYEKKDLKNSPSTLSGLPYEDEIRYRREGARYYICNFSSIFLSGGG